MMMGRDTLQPKSWRKGVKTQRGGENVSSIKV
jgi:hypothetical protein